MIKFINCLFGFILFSFSITAQERQTTNIHVNKLAYEVGESTLIYIELTEALAENDNLIVFFNNDDVSNQVYAKSETVYVFDPGIFQDPGQKVITTLIFSNNFQDLIDKNAHDFFVIEDRSENPLITIVQNNKITFFDHQDLIAGEVDRKISRSFFSDARPILYRDIAARILPFSNGYFALVRDASLQKYAVIDLLRKKQVDLNQDHRITEEDRIGAGGFNVIDSNRSKYVFLTHYGEHQVMAVDKKTGLIANRIDLEYGPFEFEGENVEVEDLHGVQVGISFNQEENLIYVLTGGLSTNQNFGFSGAIRFVDPVTLRQVSRFGEENSTDTIYLYSSFNFPDEWAGDFYNPSPTTRALNHWKSEGKLIAFDGRWGHQVIPEELLSDPETQVIALNNDFPGATLGLFTTGIAGMPMILENGPHYYYLPMSRNNIFAYNNVNGGQAVGTIETCCHDLFINIGGLQTFAWVFTQAADKIFYSDTLNLVSVASTETFESTERIETLGGSAYLSLTPNEEHLYIGDVQGHLQILDTETYEIIQTIDLSENGPIEAIHSCGLTPNNSDSLRRACTNSASSLEAELR